MINYGKQSISKKDINYVTRALVSENLTCGKEVFGFEKDFCEYTGARYAIAVSSATSALYMLALLLKRKYNQVKVPSITFIADINPFELLDYDIDVLDIEKEQPLIDVKNTIYKNIGIVVDMCGFPYTGNKHQFSIRDACHSLGGRYYKNGKWNVIGNCADDDVCVFSFHPVKPITTGEGGMITTNNEVLYKELLRLRSHGFTEGYMLPSPSLNFRMTDIQAALGRSQLKKLNKFISIRREIAETYYEAFKNISEITTIKETKNQYCGFHLFPILIENRDKLKEELYKKGINCQIHYKPIHRMEYYNLDINEYPNSEYWYAHELSLPIYPDLKKSELKYIIKNIKDLIK